MQIKAMLMVTISLVISFQTLVLAQGASTESADWDNIPAGRGKCYNTEILLKDTFTISQISVSYVTGNIYYINSIDRLKVLKKGKKKTEEITIPMIYINTIAADNFAAHVYIGYTTGMKMYYEYSGKIEDVRGRTENILELFMPKGIRTLYAVVATVYYNAVYIYEVYKYDKLTLKGEKLPITIDPTSDINFVADLAGNYYFKKKNVNGMIALNVLVKGSSSEMEYEFSAGINQLAVNEEGKVYATSLHTLYRLKTDNKEPQLIHPLGFDTTAMSFDENNNIVFGSQQNNSLILMKLEDECFKVRRGMLVRAKSQ